MSDPTISVVIPVHDGARYLAAAIESALGQVPAPAEVIVVDDGSTDGTAEIARAFAAAPVAYLHQERGGIGAARNRGVAAARGDFLAFLDADDLWLEGKLRAQLDALAGKEATHLAFAHVQEFVSPDLPPELAGRLRPHPGPIPGRFATTLLLQREAFLRIGSFSTQWQLAEFIDWYARAEDAGLQAIVLPQVLARRRLHASNQGRQNRARHSQYAGVLKLILDRRKAASRPPS